jgi:hypothetical protein
MLVVSADSTYEVRESTPGVAQLSFRTWQRLQAKTHPTAPSLFVLHE